MSQSCSWGLMVIILLGVAVLIISSGCISTEITQFRGERFQHHSIFSESKYQKKKPTSAPSRIPPAKKRRNNIKAQTFDLTNCSRVWPKLELFLPIKIVDDVSNSSKNNLQHSRNMEWSNIFLRTFVLFWPTVSNTEIRLIVDAEVNSNIGTSVALNTHVLAFLNSTTRILDTYFPRIRVSFNQPFLNVYNTGHDRQQYLMFYADNFTSTSSEFVGFVDSDTSFHSFVDREDIFEDNKPVIHGRLQRWKSHGTDKDKRHWAFMTKKALGLEEPMLCMNYFPVVFKITHLKALRDFITQRFKKRTFAEAFRHFTESESGDTKIGRYSQFNIMCTFMWWFQRDSYTWYIHDTTVCTANILFTILSR